MDEVFDIAEAYTGIDAPSTVSGGVFWWLGRLVGGLETVARPPQGLESELLQFFGSGQVLTDNSKATEELGIEHRPLEEGGSRPPGLGT